MGFQRLNPKNTRRISDVTGLDIVRAWGHGGSHAKAFVTAGHNHGSYDPVGGHWRFDGSPFHFDTCDELFPPGDQSVTERGQQERELYAEHLAAVAAEDAARLAQRREQSAAARANIMRAMTG